MSQSQNASSSHDRTREALESAKAAIGNIIDLEFITPSDDDAFDEVVDALELINAVLKN